MSNGLPVHKTPEKKVFGIIGETISTDEGEVYTKQSSDTRNVGWNEILQQVPSPTPTATPTLTPTGTRPFIVTQTVSSTMFTPTPTNTPFPTLTKFVAPTFTPTPTLTATITPTLTTTQNLPTQTPTLTPSIPIPTPTHTSYAIGATIDWAVDSVVSQTFGGGYLVGDVLKANYAITSQGNTSSFAIYQRSGDPDPSVGPWIAITGSNYTYVAPTAGYYQLKITVNYNDGRTISVESSVITVVSFDRPSVTVSPSSVTRGAGTVSTITIAEGFAGYGYITSWGITGDYALESSGQNIFNTVLENNIAGYGTFYLNPFKRLSNGRTIYGTSQTVKIQRQTYRIGYTLDASGYIRFSYDDADGVPQTLEKYGTPYQTIYPDYASPCASSVTLLTPGGVGRSVSLTSVQC